jgi:hypothetical protein
MGRARIVLFAHGYYFIFRDNKVLWNKRDIRDQQHCGIHIYIFARYFNGMLISIGLAVVEVSVVTFRVVAVLLPRICIDWWGDISSRLIVHGKLQQVFQYCQQ